MSNINIETSSLRTIQNSFLTLKRGFQLLLVCLIILFIASFSTIYYLIRTGNEKVYIVSPNQTFLAYANYNHEISIYEARNHIRNFCENIFGWDKDNYKDHIEYALNLIDHTDGLKIFNTFKSSEVYENLIATSAKVTVNIDSILLDMKSLPIKGNFYLTQVWQSPGGIQYQKIKAHFEIIAVSRSETNPFGLEIQKIMFLDYKQKSSTQDSLKSRNAIP